MDVPMEDSTQSDQAKTIARINDFEQLFVLLSKISLNQAEQNKIVIGLQEINSTFEYIINFPTILEAFISRTLPIILEFLSNGPKNFIYEHSEHSIRKNLLEILSRYPPTEVRKLGPTLYSIMLNLIEEDNEEIATLAFRLIYDLDRKSPPKTFEDVKNTSSHLKRITQNIVNNMPKALQNPDSIAIANNLGEGNIDKNVLPNLFYARLIEDAKGQKMRLMPKGCNSIKFLCEIPQFFIFIQSILKGDVEGEMHEMIGYALKIVQCRFDRNDPNLNQDAFIEFFRVQTRFFSFISLMTKNFDEKKLSYIQADKMPEILLYLFKHCPNETPFIRKDLLTSSRMFLVPSYRMHFAKYVESFLDIQVIIGTNQFNHDQIKSSAYGIVYDVLHHTRDQLTSKQIEMAVTIFCKNLYDSSFQSIISVMTCRLLLNLVECYGKACEKEGKPADGNELLMKAFHLFTSKVAQIVKYVFPCVRRELDKNAKLFEDNFGPNRANDPKIVQEFVDSLTSDMLPNGETTGKKDFFLTKDSTKLSFDFPDGTIYTSADSRMMLKTFFNALKMLATKMKDYSDRSETMLNTTLCQQISQQVSQKEMNRQKGINVPNVPIEFPIKYGYVQNKNLDVFIKLFTKGLKVFDIFNITNSMDERTDANGNVVNTKSLVLVKEEADLMELFSNIFMLLAPHTFRTLLRLTIDDFVKAIYQNPSLTHIANSFLSKRQTALIFATVLIDYLIERMDVLGHQNEISNLHLRLFKDIFKSVSYFSSDMQHMLKPHLNKIVNNSMQMALKAPEPFNFFLLLRALFRSIGGGIHEALYQEFLPMLRSLLQGLNALQSGVHRQNLKDLFVELCLTIPVRLSSLLPYLPWLMDPLVAALNANQIQVISQGLRTLELCVDNLQPDFLYEHILPIRTELMQALWKTLRNNQDHIASVAFRILGKLGGSNHKLMMEPHKLEYLDWRDPAIFSSFFDDDIAAQQLLNQVSPPNFPRGTFSHITLNFPETAINTSHANQHTANHSTPIHLPIDRIIEVAFQQLKAPNTDSFYKKQCWEIIKSFFAAHLQQYAKEEDRKLFHKEFSKLFSGSSSDFLNSQTCEIFSHNKFANFIKFPDDRIRKTHELALTAMLIASVNPELKESVNKFMVPMIRHYVLVAIFQQVKLNREKVPSNFGEIPKTNGMDPFVLVDATLAIISEENKNISGLSVKILHLIFDTAFLVLGSRERVGKLLLFQYILERVCSLCYERAWFCKQGGCVAMRFLFRNMSLKWNFIHLYTMLKAMIFVMIDLSNDLSSGVIYSAKENVEEMIRICCKPLDLGSQSSELNEAQKSAIHQLTKELIKNITNSDTFLRTEAMRMLQVVADVIGQNLTDVIRPHYEILSDMIPPKRHKLHQHTCVVQIGILDANFFGVTLNPSLFVIDENNEEHMVFVRDVLSITTQSDETLHKYPCYKTVEDLVPLRKSCLKFLSTCGHMNSVREPIFVALMAALESDDIRLQECSYECFKKYPQLKEVSPELRSNYTRKFLSSTSGNQLQVSTLCRFQKFAELFAISHERITETLMSQLKNQMNHCLAFLRKLREKDFRQKSHIINQYKQNIKDPNVSDMKLLMKAQENYEHSTKIIHLDIMVLLKICREIIRTFCHIKEVNESYVEKLCIFLIDTEAILDTFVSRYFHECVKQFFHRYPAKAIAVVESRCFNDPENTVFSFLRYLLEAPDGGPFRAALENNFGNMLNVLKNGLIKTDEPMDIGGASPARSVSSVHSSASSHHQQQQFNQSMVSLNRFKVVRIISILIKFNPDFLNNQPEVLATLKTLWLSDLMYQDAESKILLMDPIQWREPRLVAKCLLAYFKKNPNEIEILFMLLKSFCRTFFCNFNFLVTFLNVNVREQYSIEWKRAVFLKFIDIYHCREAPSEGGVIYSQELISRILQYICIPLFSHSFKNGTGNELIAGPNDSGQNLIHAFLPLILPEQVRQVCDTIKIYLSQLCCLVVEHASHYIKRQGGEANNQHYELRHLMGFAWLSLESKNLDPYYKYYGHLLFAHLITKFQVKYTIVQRLFSSLMQANVAETRPIVREALAIMVPTLISKTDGAQLLSRITKNVVVQDGNQVMVIFFTMQFIVRNYDHFYRKRHLFLNHITQFINKVGLALNATIENRKLVLDLIEVILRWEHRRIAEQRSRNYRDFDGLLPDGEEFQDEYQDNILFNLTRFICLVPEFNYPGSPFQQLNNNTLAGCPSITLDADYFSKRSLNLLKMFFHLEIWPRVEFKHTMIERALNKPPQDDSSKYNTVCVGLEILILLLETVNKEQILPLFIGLQKSIITCCSYNNSEVLKTVCTLLSKLMAIFPTNCSNTNVPPNKLPTKELDGHSPFLQPLEQLYLDIHTIILNGLNHYEKYNGIAHATNIVVTKIQTNQSSIDNYGVTIQDLQEIQGSIITLNRILHVLKAACDTQPAYIDRLFTPLTTTIAKLVKEHGQLVKLQNYIEIQPSFCADTIVVGMELIKPRIPFVSHEIRRNFIQNIFFQLIERTNDMKLLAACLRLLDSWIRMSNQTPNQKANMISAQIREKVQLLFRFFLNIDKRLGSEDSEVKRNFLELIHFIYTDDSLRSCDLAAKLETAFMWGLKSNNPEIRQKFFAILDNHLKKRLYDRVMYILCEQNWESMHSYYWINQCTELLLILANPQVQLTTPNSFSMVPLPTSFLFKPEEKIMGTYIGAPSEPMQIGYSNFFCTVFDDLDPENIEEADGGTGNRENLLDSLNQFYNNLATVQASSFLNGVSQLCYLDAHVSHHIWVQLFPRIFAILGDRQQVLLSLSIAPFLISGSHIQQKDAPISSIGTFFEAITYCRPKVVLRPNIMKYIGKNHNQWHRVILMLEEAVESNATTDPSVGVGGILLNGMGNAALFAQATEGVKRGDKQPKNAPDNPFGPLELFPNELTMPTVTYYQECSQVLAQIYEDLREEDYWCGIWQRLAIYPQTLIGLAYESQGFFEQAKASYELAMNKARDEFDGTNNSAPYALNAEYCLWEQHWIRCSKELNQWDFLLEYASHPDVKNPWLIMESAWRLPNWDRMNDGLSLVESNLPKELLWKCAMYKGYNWICNPAVRNIEKVQTMTDLSTNALINEWRRLPFIVSSIHMDFLHAAHQIVELHEAGCLHQTLAYGATQQQQSNVTPSGQERTQPVDMKAVVKTWKNRLPVTTDDLSHWSDIFSWRQHHYDAIVQRFEPQGTYKSDPSSALLGAHANAQSLIHYAKIARKHNLVGVSLDSLNRIHTIPKVPIVDCFQKIKQQLKCYLSLHYTHNSVDELQEGLSVIESTHLKYFQREMISEFYALKGHFLRMLHQYDEAEKSFSVAVQMHDVLVKSWALWGDFSNELFMKDPSEPKDMKRAISAIIAYLHACRIQNEPKARKFLSKVLFLQSYDDAQHSIAKTTEQYNVGVPPQNWVPWIPQLFQSLSRSEGAYLINILIHVSKGYPQSVYFPARTLYATLRLEHKEMRTKVNYCCNTPQPPIQIRDNDQIQVSVVLARCTKVMAAQRDAHPTLLSTLEGIIDQFLCLNFENWHDPMLKMLKQVLSKYYQVSFENRDHVENIPFTPQMINLSKKLTHTFTNCVELHVKQMQDENDSGKIRVDSSKRSQTSMNIQECHRLKEQFIKDMEECLSSEPAQKFPILGVKLKKWIKIFENISKTCPKHWYLEEKCRFLSNFSKQTFDHISLPGEFIPKSSNGSNVYIAKFMPRVEVVFRDNTTARRIFIRGHNGRIYPYLVFNDVSSFEARLEERFLQFQKLTNMYFGKNKETARRLLNFTLPKIVAFGPSNRLVEDNLSSLSLLDIHKQYLASRNHSPDVCLTRYYERMAAIQSKGDKATKQNLRDIVQEIQENFAPPTLIRNWAFQTYNNATEFWHFRKLFTQQLSVSNLCEHAFFLNRLNPEMLNFHRDSGLVSISYFRFDLHDEVPDPSSPNAPVPFRLSHSIQNFITKCGQQGPFSSTMIATAGCFTNPNYKVRSFLLAILRDEVISSHKRMWVNDKHQLISRLANTIRENRNHHSILQILNEIRREPDEISSAELTAKSIKAVNSIFSRLKVISTFDGSDNKVAELIRFATDTDKLAAMNPVWHPWL